MVSISFLHGNLWISVDKVDNFVYKSVFRLFYVFLCVDNFPCLHHVKSLISSIFWHFLCIMSKSTFIYGGLHSICDFVSFILSMLFSFGDVLLSMVCCFLWYAAFPQYAALYGIHIGNICPLSFALCKRDRHIWFFYPTVPTFFHFIWYTNAKIFYIPKTHHYSLHYITFLGIQRKKIHICPKQKTPV